MKSILITGSTGFVGSNLVPFLSKCKIICPDRAQLGDSPIAECDSIIHLAGKAHDLKATSNAEEYYTINYELTKKLYDDFLASKATKFIFISSVKASADKVEDILRESDLPSPQTPYGKSKLLAEQYIQAQPLPEGKSYYILRPCMIHGPGNKGNLNLLHKLVSKGIPYPLAAFENRRSFLSVENLCFVINELLERSDIAPGIYNVADDEVISTNLLIKLMAEASDRKPRLWRVSSGLIRSIARLGDMLKLPLTTERLRKLTESYVVDSRKIQEALQKKLPVQTRDGIITTVKSFLK